MRSLLELLEWIVGICLVVYLVALLNYEWAQVTLWAGHFMERLLNGY